jgi:hypothetical protein
MIKASKLKKKLYEGHLFLIQDFTSNSKSFLKLRSFFNILETSRDLASSTSLQGSFVPHCTAKNAPPPFLHFTGRWFFYFLEELAF